MRKKRCDNDGRRSSCQMTRRLLAASSIDTAPSQTGALYSAGHLTAVLRQADPYLALELVRFWHLSIHCCLLPADRQRAFSGSAP